MDRESTVERQHTRVPVCAEVFAYDQGRAFGPGSEQGDEWKRVERSFSLRPVMTIY